MHRNDHRGSLAIVLECIRLKPIGDEAAIGELANTAGRIACDPLPEAAVVNIAAVGIGRKPFPDRESVASAVMKRERPRGPRTAKVRPSAAISTSGTGVKAAHTIARAAGANPLQRSGVLNKPMTSRPAVASKSGPVPNKVTRPNAPGRLATHSPTASIHSMP